MKNAFSDYYSPSDAEYERFLKEGIIALDANVLLAPYKVDADARKQIFGILTQLKDRLWAPYQAGYEFFKNRPAVMAGEDKVYQNLETPLTTARKKIDEHLKSITGHPVITPSDAKGILSAIDEVISKVETLRKGKDSRLEDYLRDDPILKKWEALLESRIGECPSNQNLRELTDIVGKRYMEGVPPGLQDEDKPENSYGDGILWLQLLDKANESKLPTLLITDDVKDDWYRRHGGKTIGPRVELVREMRESAGVPYYQQPLSFFVQRAGKVLNRPVSENTVRQVVGLSSSVSGASFEQSVHSELLNQFPATDVLEYPQDFATADLAVRVGSLTVGVLLTLEARSLGGNTLQRLSKALRGRRFNAILLVTNKPLTQMDRDALAGIANATTKPFDVAHWSPMRSNSPHLANAVVMLAEQALSPAWRS
ncbi:PIN-like domain-containing protein [Streptomyces rubiginosohelvolus]|uniref:PIN-like domain-containing protein n=1 Tax=Streptomyces rubiginosohelvolus TaxID=67362 RepID=UPI0036FC5E89